MFIKGLIIGLIFGIPAGAVGALTIERTLKYGFWTGFLSGLGCSTADLIYACIGVFGITFVSDFIIDNQLVINTAGGIILLLMGIRLLVKTNADTNLQLRKSGILKMYFSSFILGITNPAGILTFIWAFAWFGITGKIDFEKGCFAATGVFVGTAVWWFLLALGAVIFKERAGKKTILKTDKIFGVLIILFSALVFIKMLIN